MLQTWSKMLANAFGFDRRAYVKLTPEQLFRRDVVIQCELHEIDTELPEIQQVLANPARYIGEENEFRFYDLLRELNPKRDIVRRDDGSLYMMERLYRSWVLFAWTVARRNVYELDERLCKIVVHDSGLQLRDVHDHIMFTFGAAAIQPFRLGSDGLRERNAAAIIQEFTGQVIDWKSGEPNRVISGLTVERDSNRDNWKPYVFSYITADA